MKNTGKKNTGGRGMKNPEDTWHLDRLVTLTKQQANASTPSAYSRYTAQLDEERLALKELGYSDREINYLEVKAEFMNNPKRKSKRRNPYVDGGAGQTFDIYPSGSGIYINKIKGGKIKITKLSDIMGHAANPKSRRRNPRKSAGKDILPTLLIGTAIVAAIGYAGRQYTKE